MVWSVTFNTQSGELCNVNHTYARFNISMCDNNWFWKGLFRGLCCDYHIKSCIFQFLSLVHAKRSDVNTTCLYCSVTKSFTYLIELWLHTVMAGSSRLSL